MYEIIIKGLEEIGICIDVDLDKLSNNNNDIDLQNYITDSITFITFIINIESILGFELPDDLLLYERISSIKAFSLYLEDILKNT